MEIMKSMELPWPSCGERRAHGQSRKPEANQYKISLMRAINEPAVVTIYGSVVRLHDWDTTIGKGE